MYFIDRIFFFIINQNDMNIKQNFSRRSFTAIVAFFSILALSAQIPTGYYSSAEMQAGAQLKTSLHNIIKVGTRLSYGSGNGATWSGFEKTDLHPSGKVWDMYSNNTYYFPGNGKAPSGMNIEHSFAKSWWGGSKNDAYKDLFHLNPSYSAANSARGSFPPGEVGSNYKTTGTIKVGDNSFGSYTGTCFEPEDQYKGDFARAYMYMIVCYQNLNLTDSENSRTAIQSDPLYKYTFKPWFKDLILKWHREDPVSQKEMTRQAEIYKIQDNRNPFIDYPELAEYLWGAFVGQVWSSSGSVTNPWITSPYDGTTVEFQPTPILTSTSDTIIIKGMNLESNLVISISGTDASCFSPNTNSISVADAESEDGKMLIVQFSPNDLDDHTAILTISGGGLTNNIEVNLEGEGTNEFKATDASNITPSSFTANWSMDFGATGYELNVYSLIENGEVGEIEIFNTTFENGQFEDGVQKTSGYSSFEDNTLRMGSGSQNCTIAIPALDLTKDSVIIYVNAKQYNNDAGAELYFIVDNQEVGQISTSRDMNEYRLNIGGHNANSIVSIAAKADNRVYLQDIKIVDLGNIQSRDTLAGYPITLGDVHSHVVNVPDFANTAYYYYVTSIGGTESTSNNVKVVYTGTTDNNDTNKDEIIVYQNNSTVFVEGFKENSTIYIYSINGYLIDSFQASNSTSYNTSSLPKGLYILRINNKYYSKSIKFSTAK